MRRQRKSIRRLGLFLALALILLPAGTGRAAGPENAAGESPAGNQSANQSINQDVLDARNGGAGIPEPAGGVKRRRPVLSGGPHQCVSSGIGGEKT